MKLKLFVLLGSISLMFSGCAVTKYHWGNYENSLYNYYKNPSEVEQLGENLSKIIADGEANGEVPPGVYAEYGYVLHILGKSSEAVIFFEKEKKLGRSPKY